MKRKLSLLLSMLMVLSLFTVIPVADGDGEITILDVTEIQRWLAGLTANNRIGS